MHKSEKTRPPESGVGAEIAAMVDPSDPADAPDPTEVKPRDEESEGWLLVALLAAAASRAGSVGLDMDEKTEPGTGSPPSSPDGPVLPLSHSHSHSSSHSPSPMPLAQEYVRLLRQPGTSGAVAPLTLGRFEVIGILGKGGFGTVYLAHDPRLERCVALKVPHPEVILSSSARERFLREGRAAARLDHPAIVPVLEVEEPNPIGTIAYAYCPGPTLSQWLRSRTEPVPPRKAAALAATLADAVSHAHGREILHRDIKPSNVILTGLPSVREQPRGASVPPEPEAETAETDLSPKLTDFGMARIVSEVGDDTKSGVPFGSPSYMAPEQAAGRVRQVGPWTDVYALGAVLYEVLTGRPPFRGDTPAETILQVLGDQPVSPRALRRKIPRDLETIVLTCLQKQPSRRYASASALRDDLRRFLEGRPIAARPEWWISPGVRWLRRRPLLFAGVIVAAILPVFLLGGMLAWNASLRALNVKLSTARDRAQESTVLAEQYLYGTSLREAADALAGGQPERAQELLHALEETPAWGHSHEFTWRYVRRESDRAVTLLSRAGENVEAVGISADGREVVTVDRGGTIRLRESTTGSLRWRATARLIPYIRVAIAGDGSRVAVAGRESGSGPCVLLLFEGGTGQRLGRHVLGEGEPLALRFGEDAGTVWLLHTRPGEPVEQVRLRCEEGGTGGLWTCREAGRWRSDELTVSADGRRVVRWGGASGPLTVEDVAGGAVLWRAAQGVVEIRRAALSGDGRRVAAVVGQPGGQVLLVWDVDKGGEVGSYSAPEEPFVQMALSYDGAVLMGRQTSGRTVVRGVGVSFETDPMVGDPGRVTGGNSELDPMGRTVVTSQNSIIGGIHPLELYDVAGGRLLSRFPGSAQRGIDVAYSADGRTIAVRSGRRALSWRLDSEPDPRLSGHAVEAWSAAYTPDGKLLATGSDNDGESLTLRVWDVATGRQVAAWNAHPDGTTAAMAMHPSQPLLATAALAESGNLRLWKIPSGELVADLPGNTNWLRALAFSPDGKYLAAGGNERVVRVYEMPSGRLWRTLGGPTDKVRALAFSPDGKYLAAGGNDGAVRVWGLAENATGEPRVAPGDVLVTALSYTPDGRMLVAGEEEGGLVIRDAKTLTPLRRLDTGCEELRCLAIALKGPTLASPGEPGTLALWDYETGQRLATLDVGPAKLQSLRFAPDGTSLVVCDHGGGVRLLRAPEPSRIEAEGAKADP